ncbi:MAG TPA: SET domain-containing protein-lysine N-methyltransferase, partial [Gammaproteobacteria bacterium]
MSIHVEVEVRETASRGRGVFALAAIPAGSLIETAHVIPIPQAEMAAIESCILADYDFHWGE